MTRRRAEERRVDEHAGDAALLYEQLEVLGARRTLLEEQLGAGAAREARRGRISRELLDALQEPLTPGRSEEHTSELQSRRELVCRPLLEKKTSLPGCAGGEHAAPHRSEGRPEARREL